MDTVGWEFWILRAALVGAFGIALVWLDRLLSRVQNWLTWTLRFSVLFGLSFLAVAYDLSLSTASSGETATGLWVIGGIGMVVGLFGIPISFVRWVDTWDHGLQKSKQRPKEPAAEAEGVVTDSNNQLEGRTIPEYSIEEARLTLLKAIDLANEKLLIDRLYSVARDLETLHAVVDDDDDLDDPEDDDYPRLYGDLFLGRSGKVWSLLIDHGYQAFDLKFFAKEYIPTLDQCRHVMVQLGDHTLAEVSYEPAIDDPSMCSDWRATEVETLSGTAWLDELEQLAASYVERGKLFAGYRLRKSHEAEEKEVIERAKKIRLDD